MISFADFDYVIETLKNCVCKWLQFFQRQQPYWKSLRVDDVILHLRSFTRPLRKNNAE
jgi:hypothetical protein